jgi:putative membrane protein
MIIGKPKHGLSLLITMHGSVLPRILPRITAVMACAAAITWIDTYVLPLQHANAAAFTGFGVALSLFLGFRNNAAYERWWEGRKLWGQLIADARSLAREATVFLPETPRHELIRVVLAFVHLHRVNLRQRPADAELRRWSTRDGDTAVLALNRATEIIQRSYRSGALDGFGARSLTERLANMGLAQAGCERIATTPLPFVYSLLVYRTCVLYCLLLPL